MPLAAGTKAPDFTLRDQHREKRSLSELAGAPAMIVFMPFAFTRTCEGEMCSIRDNLDYLQSKGAKVFVITCDTLNSNRVWAEQQGFTFPILSDFWPHGKVASSYGCFNETFGYAERSTFFLDADGVITEVVSSERLDVPRESTNTPKPSAFRRTQGSQGGCTYLPAQRTIRGGGRYRGGPERPSRRGR